MFEPSKVYAGNTFIISSLASASSVTASLLGGNHLSLQRETQHFGLFSMPDWTTGFTVVIGVVLLKSMDGLIGTQGKSETTTFPFNK